MSQSIKVVVRGGAEEMEHNVTVHQSCSERWGGGNGT